MLGVAELGRCFGNVENLVRTRLELVDQTTGLL